ncbi:hypothetical protein ABMA27_016880 [Loxostege sticticalis]|uniref:Major facilitator superfamily (MFS) profile domain-containing protein n=1 Tax=Loxostege sticticalis TaxID=481309 RepID=A0ABR3I3Z6_LOXSC
MSSTNRNLEPEYQKVPVVENEKSYNIPDSYGYGVRHVQILMGFLSLSVAYISRAHMAVTIVAMTNTLHTNNNTIQVDLYKNITNDVSENTTAWEDIDYENETVFEDDFEIENSTVQTSQKSKRSLSNQNKSSDSIINTTYNWPKSTQEMVLGGFFLGYSIMMIPMGMVSQKFGGKLPLQIALLVNGVASVITPWMAVWGGWKAVSACRVIQGLSQAGCFPGLQLLIAKWSSPGERGRFLSWVFTGSTFGTVLGFQAAGLLAAKGWPYTFWATGSLCLVMFLILTLFGASSPSEHKTISDMEKMFITGKASDDIKPKRLVPVKAILRNKHVWAIWCTHVGSVVAFVFFFSQAPTYIHYILKFDVKKSGLLSSLPYVASFITSLVYGSLSDCLTNRNILSLKSARRISNTYSQFGVAICFLAVSFTNNVELAIFCLVMAMACQSALHTGWMVNLIDLSPNFSGSILSFGNAASYLTSLSLPILVSFIVTDVTNQFQWRIIFIAMAGIVTVTNIVYVMFMSAETQPWDDDGYEKTETEEQHKDRKC